MTISNHIILSGRVLRVASQVFKDATESCIEGKCDLCDWFSLRQIATWILAHESVALTPQNIDDIRQILKRIFKRFPELSTDIRYLWDELKLGELNLEVSID